MNYDDKNDEITPYDLPIGDDDDNEPTLVSGEENIPHAQEENQSAFNEIPGPVDNTTADYPNNEASDSFNTDADSFNDVSIESFDETNLDDLAVFDENVSGSYPDQPPLYETFDAQTKHSKKGVKALLPLVMICIIIALPIVLYLIYSDMINVPYLSDMMAKIKNANSQRVEHVTDEDVLPSLPDSSTGNEEVDKELQDLLTEGSEDTGVTVTRGNDQNLPALPGVQQSAGRTGDMDLPPLPGADRRNVPVEEIIQPYSHSIGRMDPFNPSGGTSQMYDIIVPPTNPTPDEKAQQLMALKISGIMYSADSPSAIINIAGSDQLVRRGDKFNGFSVEKITQDKVTVRAGSNTYTASVGEILNIANVGVNAIPNLNRKFAGPYSKGNDRIIEINMLE